MIENDSLRIAIISLYEYDYQILKLFEEEYQEMQFHTSYFNEINQQIAPSLQFDEQGNIIGLEQPVLMSEPDRKILLSFAFNTVGLHVKVFCIAFRFKVIDGIYQSIIVVWHNRIF